MASDQTPGHRAEQGPRSVTIIGPGRVGRSFATVLGQHGWTIRAQLGSDADPADVATAAEGVDVVLVTVPDDRISSVAASVEPGRAAILHTSGAKGLDVLAPHPMATRGSIHPLISLPDPTTGAARLGSGPVFAVAGNRLAAEIVATLGGRAVEVDDADRARYHATAAVAANHLVALCAQVERLASDLGVPLDAYWELMATTLDNVRHQGPVSSITGPAARGDTTTLSLHLDALPPDERPLYRSLAQAAADLAGRTDLDLATIGQPPMNADGAAGRLAPPPTGSPEPTEPETIETIAELRARLDEHRRAGRSVGFVPTMGYLHDGHGSLMRAAASNDDIVVASIFVNPLQFAPDEDLDAYPRDLTGDTAVAGAAGVHLLFTPTVREMYPAGAVLTSVSVADVSEQWDGASRPTHFAGVATVVSKLFNIVGPCRAYFGLKDFQQLAVITRMAADLSIPVEVVGCPIRREDDGLAMSSRNVYLSPEDRAAATVLRRALEAGQRAYADGERSPAAIDAVMADVVAAEPRAELDYVAAVDAATLTQPEQLGSPAEVRLLIAAHLGSTRLIDNCAVDDGPLAPTGAP